MATPCYQNPLNLDTTYDPLLTLVGAYRTELDAYNVDDHRPSEIEEALWGRLAHHTPACASDEGAFAALALIAKELEDHTGNDMTEALLEAVLAYARRKALNS